MAEQLLGRIPIMTRSEEFQRSIRNLQLQPLITPDDVKKFRVVYGEELLPELEQAIEDCTEHNNQFFFAGHRGCGKSTLLAEFGRQIEDRFFTVFFSISDLIELPAINHVQILFTMAVQLMAKAEEKQIKIPQDKKQAIFDWFKKRTRTETEEFSAELEAGFDFFSLIKGKIKTDAGVRDEIQTDFQRNPKELLDNINLIAREIQLACGNSIQDIVVIIDDIDKLTLAQAEEIFRQNLKLLLLPQFTVIFTIPIATLRDGVLKKYIEDETGNSIFVMPVLKPHAKGDRTKILENTQHLLLAVLDRRVPAHLFAAGIAEQIIAQSGGVLRELIRIAHECCRLARVEILQRQRRQESVEDLYLDGRILDKALENLRNSMAITLSKDDREILQLTYANHQPDDPKDQAFLDLLHNITAIEYRNGESWYDVHPLVVEQLRREGLLL